MPLKTLIAFTVALTLFAASPAFAQYDLRWYSVDCGGGTSSGGTFVVTGTIGQFDASSPMTGGTFVLTGGFWASGGPTIIPCPSDVAPPGGDGLVNVNDLLTVINGWGACPVPCPPYCLADVNDDCAVNVNDLLAVINAWGACP